MEDLKYSSINVFRNVPPDSEGNEHGFNYYTNKHTHIVNPLNFVMLHIIMVSHILHAFIYGNKPYMTCQENVMHGFFRLNSYMVIVMCKYVRNLMGISCS